MIKITDLTMEIPRGDTGGPISFPILDAETQEGDVCGWGLKKDGRLVDRTRMILPIVDGYANLMLTNEYTKNLPSGKYTWDLRVVLMPIWNETHTDIIGGQEVGSPFDLGENIPWFIVKGVSAYV